jgi:hypothetical protein
MLGKVSFLSYLNVRRFGSFKNNENTQKANDGICDTCRNKDFEKFIIVVHQSINDDI